MNKIKIENLVYENINLEISNTDDGIKITFIGTIDMEYPQLKLDGYFFQIHEAILLHQIKTVYCDFQFLSYINSSGIRCIVKWLVNLMNIKEEEKKYNMFFLINTEYEWQNASLGFLTDLCPELIHVKE